MSVLEKLGSASKTVADVERKSNTCWNETTAQDDGTIRRETRFGDYEQYEMIYSGPHFSLANPFYKTPREVCTINSHYDEIDAELLDESFFARSNYIPATNLIAVESGQKGLVTGYEPDALGQPKPIYNSWFDHYKIAFREMLSIAGERSLQGAIIPPNVSHVHTVISLIFKDERDLVDMAGISASLVMDFLIKSTGVGDIHERRLATFPLGIAEPYRTALAVRTLRLNCLNQYYVPLWARQFSPAFLAQDWAVSDVRLSAVSTLSPSGFGPRPCATRLSAGRPS